VVKRTVKLDRSSPLYQYGRVPFRLHLSHGTATNRKDIGFTGVPKLLIIDDMDYTLPPPLPFWKAINTFWIVFGSIMYSLFTQILADRGPVYLGHRGLQAESPGPRKL
jgi:hypothetical protein